MKPPMNHIAYKVSSTRNKYGDFITGTETVKNCHVRIITSKIIDNNEVIESDAMFWFEPDSGVQKGDIIKFEDTHYQVERVTLARTLESTEVHFIKVEATKYGTIS